MRILILGNGFDISHGLSTKWSDFRKEVEGNEENQDYVKLSKKIKEYELDKNYNLWSDVEKALGKIWKDKKSEELDKFLDLFTICFQRYLKENINIEKEENINIEKEENSNLIKFFKSFDYIINFNYTDTLEKLYGINHNVWHIHGKINDDILEMVHVIIGCDEGNEYYSLDSFDEENGISKSNLNCRKIFNKFSGGMKQAANYESTFALFDLDQSVGFMSALDYEKISISSWGFSFSESDKHFTDQILRYPNIKIEKIYTYKPDLEEFPPSDVKILNRFGVKMSNAHNHLAYSEDLLKG